MGKAGWLLVLVGLVLAAAPVWAGACMPNSCSRSQRGCIGWRSQAEIGWALSGGVKSQPGRIEPGCIGRATAAKLFEGYLTAGGGVAGLLTVKIGCF